MLDLADRETLDLVHSLGARIRFEAFRKTDEPRATHYSVVSAEREIFRQSGVFLCGRHPSTTAMMRAGRQPDMQ